MTSFLSTDNMDGAEPDEWRLHMLSVCLWHAKDVDDRFNGSETELAVRHLSQCHLIIRFL